jgi:hypothetical protein
LRSGNGAGDSLRLVTEGSVSGDDEFENEERLPVLLIALRIDAPRQTLLVQARLEDLTNMDYKLGFDEI